MAKGRKGNKPGSGGSGNASGLGAGLSAVGNAISTIGSEAGGSLAGAFKKAQADHEVSGEVARKEAESNLEGSLQALVGELKASISAAKKEKDDSQKLTNELSQQKQNAESRRQALDAEKKELEKERKQLVADQKSNAENTADIANQHRELEVKLLDAEAGFAEKNNELLEKYRVAKEEENRKFEEQKEQLVSEIEKLKLDREDVRKTVEQDAADILQELSSKKRDLDEREESLSSLREQLNRQKTRINSMQSRLEESRTEMQEEIRNEFLLQLQRAKASEESLKTQIDQYVEDEKAYQKQLRDYSTLKSQFGEDGPSALLSRLENLKQRNESLQQELELKPSADLEALCKNLKLENNELVSQLDTRTSEVSSMKLQITQSRLAVIERETLAKEKLVLEKSNELLSGRIESLREEVDELLSKQQSKTAFPALLAMDTSEAHNRMATTEGVTNLKRFADEIQQRIAWDPEANKELYFRLDDIRLFISGLAKSRLHILQGISGTGKTSLAQAFARAIGGKCETVSVQAGWRDKDDLIGHYNAFEKQFYERPCLQGLYEAQTPFYRDRPYIILLDEMNLSRPEQYFAEFLSALELDRKDQLLTLMTAAQSSSPKNFKLGRKLQIPPNVWFIGTANHDETTFEFADKTYDRAHVMELPRNEERFQINKSLQNVSYSYSSLEVAFDRAVNEHKSDVDAMLEALNLSNFVETLAEKLGVSWGNRLERQAVRFISTFLATGGEGHDAMDHLLATKVLRHGKATGRYDTEREDIEALQSDLKSLWHDFGFRKDPKACNKLLSDELRRKSSH